MGSERVLIVGAGIAGLSLSLALRDGPWRVEVVERASTSTPLGAGLAVQPNAVRALRHLGVAAAVERTGSVVDRFRYRDRTGALLCEVDLPDLWGDVGPFVGIGRSALHHALRGAPCRHGTAVASLEQQPERVRVTFRDGSSGEYDLVVGADGIGSVVRRCISRLPGPVYAGQMAWRSVAPVRPDGLDGVEFWLGADRFFGLCPAGNGTTYGFGNVATGRHLDPVAGRAGRLRRMFAGFGAPVQQYLAALPPDHDIHCAPVEWLPDVLWHAGRVALVGDAAHAMSPMMGQGGCLAIEDAVVLADELHRTADVPTALAAFAARRRDRVDWVRSQSAALAELVRLPADVRDHALRERGVAAFHDRYRPLVGAP